MNCTRPLSAWSERRPIVTITKPSRARLSAVTFFLSTVFIAACASTKVSEIPPPDVDLSGTWALNKQLSADTQGAIAHAIAEARSNVGGRGNRSGGMRGGKGGTRGSMGGVGPGGSGDRRSGKGSRVDTGQAVEPRERLDVLVDELSPSSDVVVIEQSATELIVQYGVLWQYRHLFGEELKVSIAGYDGKRLSGWQEQQYVVETKTENGSKVHERFSISSDGGQLQIALKLDSKLFSNPITVTRVYDRKAGSNEPAASMR